MKSSDIKVFCCPNCRSALLFSEKNKYEGELANQEIYEGTLICVDCNAKYPIIKSIPRFVNQNNYASSFGYQWKKFNKTQLGRQQEQISKIRFYTTTKWSDNLKDELILEAGCGAGRFTKIALETGAEIYSFGLSEAVEACLENIQHLDLRTHHHLFRADIYKIPLPHLMFDKIFCLGVLQHCPDVKRAFLSLVPFLRPGGELVVDCYLHQPLKHMFNLKYILRPFFKWWRPSWLYAFCRMVISLSYDIKLMLSKMPLVGSLISGLIPIGKLDYEPEYHFSVTQLKEIKALSMFDMLSPKYVKPQKISSLKIWIEGVGLEILELTTGYNGINVRARKPIE